jgi:DamX protein
MVLSDLTNNDSTLTDADKAEVKPLQSLLSPARQQKFELLTGLMKTQQRPLIICGPNGIGKTTILEQLAKSNNKRQLWSYIECDASLNAGMIVSYLSSVLSMRAERGTNKNDSKIAHKLANQLNQIADNGHTVMLALDDAGQLQADVITKLFAFARQCNGLQLILAITPDHLFIKRTTDYVIDECYVVEIPPLTDQESEVYTLDYLHKNKQLLTFDATAEEIATEIYAKSQGVPGIAMQELSKMTTQSSTLAGDFKPGSLVWLAAFGLIGLLIWGGLSYLGNPGGDSENPNYVDLNNSPPPLVDANTALKKLQAEQIKNHLDDNQKVMLASSKKTDNTEDSATISVVSTTEDILNSTLTEHAARLTDDHTVTASADLNQTQALDNKQTLEIRAQQPVVQVAQDAIQGPDWVLVQDGDSYTLQLMASSEMQILKEHIKHLPQLHQQLAYYHMKRNGQHWYALIYGIYPSAEAAMQASKDLPASLGKPYMQRIRKIQARIHASQ